MGNVFSSKDMMVQASTVDAKKVGLIGDITMTLSAYGAALIGLIVHTRHIPIALIQILLKMISVRGTVHAYCPPKGALPVFVIQDMHLTEH